MKTRCLVISLCVILLSMPVWGQQSLTVMFFNTENLFDAVDDSLKNDDEFTPQGSYRWTEKRYWNKLDAVAKVIAAVGDDGLPGIVGLCEVENDTVLRDLTARSALKGASYRYVMTDSPDLRGIDVALLYRRGEFQLTGYESRPVDISGYSGSPTRDILHATGRIASGDTLDIYVCHWPSRIGGEKETEPRRMVAARQVRQSVDSVIAVRRKPYIIIMGDLNEGTDCPAVVEGLGAKGIDCGADLPDDELVTVMDHTGGSYRYQGRWDSYDQFVVSASFLNGLGCSNIVDEKVWRLEFMLEDDNDYGGKKPLRTFNGRRYQHGFSDHLPIGLRIEY